MIPNILITAAPNDGKFKIGQVINADELLNEFKNEEEYEWICSIPMPSAISYMCEKIKINFKYV